MDELKELKKVRERVQKIEVSLGKLLGMTMGLKKQITKVREELEAEDG